MTDQTTAQRVIAALVAPTGIAAEHIKPEDTLAGDLRMDSLDTLEAILAVEEACRVEIPDELVESIRTVGDLIATVERMQVPA